MLPVQLGTSPLRVEDVQGLFALVGQAEFSFELKEMFLEK